MGESLHFFNWLCSYVNVNVAKAQLRPLLSSDDGQTGI